ncbi:MAG: uracil-DNA glycosylase [Gammaproteobacteria bacterium]|nr:uracil-DNA glycosylase [Gammaproteobacteria bacterium]
MNSDIGDWSTYLDGISEKDYFQNLLGFLNQQMQLSKTIYPPKDSWFRAFEYSSFINTKVIILGQDPYHGEGQAEGLSFSVPEGIKTPPSLKNIYKELATDLNINTPGHGHLTAWAKQGVLLLNSVLTVEKGSPASHANQGWEVFTDYVIALLNKNKEHLVFLLWGTYAGKKAELIDSERHLILKAPHPSPFSAHKGFFGCQHFSKTNDYLTSTNQQNINWQI